MKHVMLDLETMGHGPTSAIASIGAVKFDETGMDEINTFYQVVDLDSCLRHGLTFDASTVYWWLNQGENARKALLAEEKSSLFDAINAFETWVKADECKYLWSNGANFDAVILENAFEKTAHEWPFEFWNVRCFRTFKALLGGHDASIAPNAEKHNSLSDALHQALFIVYICKTKGVKLA